MAGLTRDDRGQLLLVGAIGLGVVLVVLAVVVNTAVFADVFASRDDTLREARDAQQTVVAVEHGVAGLVSSVNEHNDTSHAALEANLTTDLAAWDRVLASQEARRGAVTAVSLVETTDGTRVFQNTTVNGSVRPFTNESGVSDWTLATGVSGVREARLNVTTPASDADGETCATRSDCYAMTVTNASAGETWRLTVYVDSSDANPNVTVWVENASGVVDSCTVTQSHAWINVTAGTLAGDPCPALTFAEGVTAPYTVNYRNGDAIAGNYTLTVDTVVASSPHYGADDSAPSLEPRLYAATVEVTYRTAEFRLNTQRRVVPGERHA